MARVKSEYEIESLFIDRLCDIGYTYIELKNYDDVLSNFKTQLELFNAKKLIEQKGEAVLSESEFSRVMTYMDNHSVYESAKILRDNYVLNLDNGKNVYLEFLSNLKSCHFPPFTLCTSSTERKNFSVQCVFG